MSRGYLTVTEVPGEKASREQMTMLCTRYRLAAELARGRRVLEVGCGAGMGLGYLAASASRVVGGDYDASLLRKTREHYGVRQPLVVLDGARLPFRDQSFDVVILFEAIYYLRDVEAFLQDTRRVLRQGGNLVVCSANREWSGFNPSPFSVAYFSAADLRRLLVEKGFGAELFAAFPAGAAGARGRLLGWLRRLAVATHLIPKTMKGKALLKRLVYGELERLPAEVRDGMAEVPPLRPIAGDAAVTDYKVLYAIGRIP